MEKKDLRHLKRKELIDLIDKMQTESDLVSNEEVKEELGRLKEREKYLKHLRKTLSVLVVVPDMVRIPVFVVVIAAFVSILQMLMEAYMPSINKSLGIYIPLIVVNCIILGRAEAFACKNNPLASICDGIGMGLGFTLALTLLGSVRELIGAGTLFGVTLLPETCNVLLFVLPPGAFITLGYLIAIVNKLRG